MDASALFQNVLNPRERLLWVGAPPYPSGRRLGALAVGTLFVLTVAIFLRNAPIPPRMSVQRTAGLAFGVALFCSIPFSLIWFALAGDRIKAYALTDQRLLMTAGPSREDVRMVALNALAPVKVVRRPKHDKVVQFSQEGTGLMHSAAPIWTDVDGERVDARSESTWYVADPEAIGKLVEDARQMAVSTAPLTRSPAVSPRA